MPQPDLLEEAGEHDAATGRQEGTCEGKASASLARTRHDSNANDVERRAQSEGGQQAERDAREHRWGRAGVGGTGGVDAVLIGDDLPELGTDLVTALTSLDVNELI